MTAGDSRARLLEVARQEVAPDLVIENGTIANVYSGEWLPWNVEVADGRIAYTGPRSAIRDDRTRVLDARGKIVAPGYIEPHFHPWALYNPVSVLEVAIPSGTTATVADNLAFFLVGGVEGFRRVVEELASVPGHHYWVTRLVSQSRDAHERELFTPEAIREQLRWPEVLATGEVTRWIDIARGDPYLLAAFADARASGKRVDGHTAGASFDRLNAVVGAGVSADHEAITAEEATQRLRLGLWTMLRGSSLRRDLPELLGAVRDGGLDTRRITLTTDGSGPLHMAEHGMLDSLLGIAVAEGIDPMTALQMVTVNPATLLGLDQELGGIAPGRRATLLLLGARDAFRPETVLVDGEVVARDGRLETSLPTVDWEALGCRPRFCEPGLLTDPSLYPVRGDGDECVVPTMAYESAVIARRADRSFPVREGLVDLRDAPDCAYAALIDREGRWISRGIVADLFPQLDGLASTYNTAAQILVVGRSPESMAAAAREVVGLGGGVAFAGPEGVTWSAPLPVTGMASAGSFADAVSTERALGAHARAAGYPFHDVLYTLLFMVCDFLPDVRLTGEGLLEVKSGRVLRPAEILRG